MDLTNLGLFACFMASTIVHFVKCENGMDLFRVQSDYNKNLPPEKSTTVSISMFINRVSAVDENKEEISLDVFLQVYWEDPRVRVLGDFDHVELTWQQRDKFWIPDLYIRQLREMKVLLLFQEMTSVRLYKNSTLRVSIGATIMIKCDMDFVLYPLDVQKCAVDFSSYKYTSTEMNFKWKEDPPLSFPSDFGDGYRLPKYVVSFVAEKETHVIYYGEGNHSTARMLITMSREIRSHLLESYLPSTLFVIMSWGSFVVMPEVVPGRMVLLVTTLLSLVTMFDTIRNNSPNALELKCIEVWIISCTLFVFLSLLEYFVVLFGMRYEKNWRRNNSRTIRTPSSGSRFVAASLPSRMPVNPSRVVPGNDHHGDSPKKTSKNSTGKRIQNAAEYIILYCGSPRGTLDQVSLILFPLCFLIFAIGYWVSYIKESRTRINE